MTARAPRRAVSWREVENECSGLRWDVELRAMADALEVKSGIFAYSRLMWFLLLVGLLLALLFVMVLRHSHGFRGSQEHFASEERPDLKISKAWPRNDSSGG